MIRFINYICIIVQTEPKMHISLIKIQKRIWVDLLVLVVYVPFALDLIANSLIVIRSKGPLESMIEKNRFGFEICINLMAF